MAHFTPMNTGAKMRYLNHVSLDCSAQLTSFNKMSAIVVLRVLKICMDSVRRLNSGRRSGVATCSSRQSRRAQHEEL
eukprot:1159440-Pelagomonas_calceolata.AAC.11